MMVLLAVLPIVFPAVLYFFWVCLVQFDGRLNLSFYSPSEWLEFIPSPTLESFLVVGIWLGFQAILFRFGPGKWVHGSQSVAGHRLKYRMNGLFSFVLTWVLWGIALSTQVVSASYLYNHFGALLGAANILALLLGIFLFFFGHVLAPAGASQVGLVSKFILGSSLNPRVGGAELKFFFCSRPGLIAWTLMNSAFMFKQYELVGAVTAPMILVNLFQWIYVLDFFLFEEFFLRSEFIEHQKFGWMMSWVCLVWVPFGQSLQAFYLVNHPHSLSALGMLVLVGLNALGYLLFRDSLLQKARFDQDPKTMVWGKAAHFVQTKEGARLLYSGWWGLVRYAQYLGGVLMACAWSLTCLFGSVIPYLHFACIFIFYVYLLRKKESQNLGQHQLDWITYCEKVPWKLFPGLY